MKNTKEYKKGFTDGYKKAMRDSDRIRKESRKLMKPIREIIRNLNSH